MSNLESVSSQEIRKIRTVITDSIRDLQGTGSFQLNEIVNDLNRLRILLADLHQNGFVVQPLVRRIVERIDRVAPKVETKKRHVLDDIVKTLKPLN